ncbi:ATP-binding protein [Actinomycetospora termitidis]|uniref:ATP-binding protein n=1 Tax=Actinomycetospora termitidis TaxID=3053470 RepID=A0ABT7M891_9PSEU|nr:ATP-binding protein [Actinomycetospora sp. Odt1-22]MDL5155653.1 ATP-binding protein [Actinomycetospora sp. Odt1-22]
MSSQAPPDLDLTAEAAPPQVGAFRRALRRWLGEALDSAGPDPGTEDELADLADDLVLATSEALENVVDHAYAARGEPGAMSLRAELRDGTVAVVVTDHGQWREPPSGPSSRGRGLAMMERLAETSVDRGEPGTVVTLRRRLPSGAHERSAAQA